MIKPADVEVLDADGRAQLKEIERQVDAGLKETSGIVFVHIRRGWNFRLWGVVASLYESSGWKTTHVNKTPGDSFTGAALVIHHPEINPRVGVPEVSRTIPSGDPPGIITEPSQDPLSGFADPNDEPKGDSRWGSGNRGFG